MLSIICTCLQMPPKTNVHYCTIILLSIVLIQLYDTKILKHLQKNITMDPVYKC